MFPVQSPASASPTTLAGQNVPPPAAAGDSGTGGAAPPAGASQLAGSDAQAGPEGPYRPSADAKLKKDIEMLRGAEASMIELAQSYPAAAKALNTAAESLRAAQRQIVASPGGKEPPRPNTFA